MKTLRRWLLNALLFVFLLSACSLLPQKFDSTEYSYYVTLYQQVQHLKQVCGEDNEVAVRLTLLFYTSEQLGIYAMYTGNEDSKKFALDAQHQIDKFIKGKSKAYCENYMDTMHVSLVEFMKTLGARSK
jgi:hypothetical protein